jgi:hypothetical protein
MNDQSGALSFEAAIGNSQLSKDIAQIKGQISGLVRDVEKETKGIDAAFENLGKVAAGAFVFNELRQLPAQLIRVRGEFQQLEIAFETMLGSKSKADKLFADVVKLAATTPFDLKGVASGAKQLLAYGVASEDITKTLTRLGDIAAGLSIPLGDLTYLYGTTRTQGRLFSADLNQFVGRGIPLIKLLADQFKVAESEVKGLVESGKVGFPEVEKAINTLTNSGGMFAGLMEKQSKSLTGLYSNFQDAVEQAYNEVGKGQQGLLADSLKFGTTVVQNYQPILDVLKVLVVSYGAYKAAIISTAAVQAIAANQSAIRSFIGLAGSIRSAADAQALFNLVTNANPYVLAATALVALITAVAVFRDTATEAEKAQQRLNGEIAKADKIDTERKIKVDELRKAIQDENLTQEQRKKKLQELIALSPSHLKAINAENIATAESTQAIEDYIKAQKERMVQQALFDEKEKTRARIAELKAGKLDKDFAPSAFSSAGLMMAQGASGGTFNAEKEAQIEIRKNRDQAILELQEYEKTLVAKSRDGIAERKKLRDEAHKGDVADSARTVKFYDEQIKSLEDQQTTSTSAAGFKALQKQIDQLDAKRRSITGELTAEQKKYAKDAEKIGPYGSISYWDNIAQKAQEIISKTPGKNVALLTAQTKIKADAEQKAEDLRQRYAVKSFEEEIEQKRQQYEVYQRWVDAYGKQAADEQFSTLVKGNESYLDYLNTQIRKLEGLKAFTPLNKTDQGSLDLLNTERNRLTGKETGMEAFNKQLEDAQRNSQSLIETLDRLTAIQESLGTPRTDDDFAKLKQVAELRENIKRELNDVLNEFLADANVNGAKVLQIEKKYTQLTIEAKKKATGVQLKEILKSIDKAKDAELDAIKDTEFEQSDSYKKIHREYLDYGRKQIQQRILDIEEALKKEKLSIEVRKQLEIQLAKTREELSKNTADGIRSAAGILASIMGDTSIKVSKSFAISMRDISNAVQNVGTLMDSSASTADQVGSIIGIITFAITSARDAMLKASDLATEMDAQVENYQNLANELAGVNYLLERQKVLLEDLQGVDRAQGVLSLYDKYAQQQADALQRLQDLTVDTIASQKEVFVDPVFNTKVENKGFKGFWTNLMTGGKAKTKIEYQFESVDTSGFDDIEDYINLLAQIKAGGGKLFGKEVVEADVKALEELINTYNEAVEQQKALMEELRQYYTATTQEGIVDSIVQGFIDGKRSAQDFAEDFEQMMLKAVQNSLKANLLDADMKAFYDKFAEYSLSDYTLTDAEIAELKVLYNKIIEEGQKKFDDIEAITGVDLNQNEGSAPKAQTGTIAAASEETVSQMLGQFNALRIHAAENVNVARGMLLEMSAINRNTQELYAMRRSLEGIERAMSADQLRAVGGI